LLSLGSSGQWKLPLQAWPCCCFPLPGLLAWWGSWRRARNGTRRQRTCPLPPVTLSMSLNPTEHQRLALVRQVLYHSNHAPSPFCFRYFLTRVLCLHPGWPESQSSYLCFPCSWDHRNTPLCPAFFVWDGSPMNSLPRLSWTRNSPISTSQVARITGVATVPSFHGALQN
jgi:hypothetical protein